MFRQPEHPKITYTAKYSRAQKCVIIHGFIVKLMSCLHFRLPNMVIPISKGSLKIFIFPFFQIQTVYHRGDFSLSRLPAYGKNPNHKHWTIFLHAFSIFQYSIQGLD